MDIREGNNGSRVSLFTKYTFVLIGINIVFIFSVFYLFGIRAGSMSTVSLLVSMGITSADSWNREIKSDGYASLSQLYSSYLAVIFLGGGLLITSSSSYSLPISISSAILVSFLYMILVNAAAFRDIDEYEIATETYQGPAAVYRIDGPYYNHIEQSALKNKSND